MQTKQVLKQSLCMDCHVNMGTGVPDWKKRCIPCWKVWKNQQVQEPLQPPVTRVKVKNEIEHLSPAVVEMIRKRIAERKAREKAVQ